MKVKQDFSKWLDINFLAGTSANNLFTASHRPLADRQKLRKVKEQDFPEQVYIYFLKTASHIFTSLVQHTFLQQILPRLHIVHLVNKEHIGESQRAADA